jgi:hypothetical protein
MSTSVLDGNAGAKRVLIEEGGEIVRNITETFSLMRGFKSAATLRTVCAAVESQCRP